MTDLSRAESTKVSRSRLVGIIAVLLTFAAMHFARPVLLPLAAGLLIAALSWPAHHWLKARIPRGLALLATVLLVTITILALFSAVAWGVMSVADRLREQPERLEALHERLNAATQRFGVSVPDFGLGGEGTGADTSSSGTDRGAPSMTRMRGSEC